MKLLKKINQWVISSLLVMALMPASVWAAGLLKPADGSLPNLEILDHEVNVIIEDGYAITTVEQIFLNPHQQNLEAIYSFPVPEKASVAEFTVWIDGKPVTGEVLEKQQAKEVYESEKTAGRDAGLMEKDEYRTFDIKVSPVRALQDTKIRFAYIQPAHVDTGMGRYVYPLEEGGVDEHKLAFWTANETVKEHFKFNLELRPAYPVEAVRLPNQPGASIIQSDTGDWRVELASSSKDQLEGLQSGNPSPPQAFTLDKDLVVYWRHQEGLPGSVDLLTYKPEGASRGTFMLTLTPGDDLQPITEGSDWIFVLDVSGSMQGKYATLADGVQRALGKMRPNDRFRLVLFNDSAWELTSGYVNATSEQIQYYSDALLKIAPDQGTNLYAGLVKGLSRIDADRTSGIVLVTDGVANVGETRQRKFIELITQKDVRLFTFIMGNSTNRPMLEVLTRESHGFALNVSNSDDIVGKILEVTSKVTHESLHGVQLDIDGIRTSDLSPKKMGSLYRGQQLIVFGHYWGDGLADIRLKGKISGQPKQYSTQISFPAVAILNPELERLWAYAKIEDMMQEIHDFGEEADLKQAVTDLSIQYGLVTDYTSMVVVRDEVFDQLGIKRNNQKRLENEQIAHQKRQLQPVTSHRVDSAQPMFKSNRPTHGGGSGSFSGWLMLPLLVLLVGQSISRKLASRSK